MRFSWFSASILPVSPVEVERVARHAAGESLREIARRTSPAMANMGESQRCGYLRARARRPIAIQVAATLRNDQRFNALLQQQIVTKAIGHAVRILARQLTQPSAFQVGRASRLRSAA